MNIFECYNRLMRLIDCNLRISKHTYTRLARDIVKQLVEKYPNIRVSVLLIDQNGTRQANFISFLLGSSTLPGMYFFRVLLFSYDAFWFR